MNTTLSVAGGLAMLAVTMAPVMAQRTNPRMTFGGQSIDEMIADFMEEHGVPGMAVAIVQAPYIPRVTGYGVADVDRRLLVASNTMFDIGAMADAYTAVAVVQLVEQGKLALDEPISRKLSNLPAAWRDITVRQLLMHSSGIADFTRDPAYDATRANTPAQLIALVAQKPLAFAPGTDVAASATDYLLLAQLIEAASGKGYRAFVRENQFDRLGLQHTIFADEAAARVKSEVVEQNGNKHSQFLRERVYINPTEIATGYRGEAMTRVAVTAAQHPSGPARILASAMDISIWDIGLAGGILIGNPELRAVLYRATSLADGRKVPVAGAWRFPGRDGLMYVNGSDRGQSSFLSRFTHPNELVCVTLLANREGLDLTQLARRIAGAYDARLGPPAAPDGMRMQQSPYSVRETIDRLEQELRGDGYGIMARLDHAEGARKASLDLPATEQLVFGDPAAGTLLMQSRRAAVLDLPLRAVAWEEDGAVWLGYTDPVEIAKRSGITDRIAVARTMRDRLDRLALKAVMPY